MKNIQTFILALIALTLTSACATPLQRAIDQNNASAAQNLIGQEENLNRKIGSDGDSYLTHALKKGNQEMALLLIKRGIDPNLPDGRGLPPIFIAIGADYAKVVRALMAKNVEINWKDTNAKTLLHYAAVVDRPEYIEMLIKRGISVNVRDRDGNTPLHDAARFARNHKAASLLLQRGADINARNKEGNSPLMLAIQPLPRGKKIFSADLAVVMAMNYRRIKANEYEKQEELFRILMARRPNLNYKDSTGFTALHWACAAKIPNFATELINRGANVNIVSNSGYNALLASSSFIIETGEDAISRKLVPKTTNVNQAEEMHGLTMLHVAVLLGKVELTNMLLKKGAKADIENHKGETARGLAKKSYNPKIKKLFTE